MMAVALALPAYAKEMKAVSDPAVDAEPSDPAPIGNVSDWVTNADYPLDAWRNGEAGQVYYDLQVDRAGMITDCRADEGSATARLKAETCRLLRARAQFEPARNAKGVAMASVYSGYFNWERREPGLGSGSFMIRVGFTLDQRGKVRNCRVIERSGEIPAEVQRAFEKEPCPAGRSPVPIRDPDGQPVARDVVITMSVASTLAVAGGAPSGN
jgi:protein TonB